MSFWLGVFVGATVGACLGVVIAGLLLASDREDSP